MIYFIQSGANGPIKVGYSLTHPENSRLAELQSGNPKRLRLLAYAEGQRLTEHAIHKILKSSRIRGEWFSMSELLRSAISCAKNGGDLAVWVEENKPNDIPNSFPDYGEWTRSAIIRIEAAIGRPELSNILCVTQSAIGAWVNQNVTPGGRFLLTMFIIFPEFFDPLPDFDGEPHPGLSFQIRVAEQKMEALASFKARCHAIRAQREKTRLRA